MQLSTFTQFHENPQVIAWWCKKLNRILHWLTPARRRVMLIFGAIIVGISNPISYLKKSQPDTSLLALVMLVLAIFGIVWLIFQASVHYKSLPNIVKRHPQITLHLLFWLFLILLWTSTPASGIWYVVILGIVLFLPKILWRCGYMFYAGQNGKIKNHPFMQQLICLFPIFGGTNTPYGKGLDFLSKFEAGTIDALARSQLAGIKLLLLSATWALLLYLMEAFVYGSGNELTQSTGGKTIGIPKLSELVPQGGKASRFQSWLSIYCELIWQVLRIARNGHGVIGILRLFGFNVFRNTYKPLLAESVHEFWNRYYYYFKELLVNFFFMPVFMQLNGNFFKKWQQLRLFLAVFCSAFLGNTYYHLLYKESLIIHGDIYHALYSSRCDIFYALLLAIGIYVSMIRKERLGGKPLSNSIFSRYIRIFGVWTFFSLIFIWDIKSDTGFFTRFDFFLNLFSLNDLEVVRVVNSI